MKEKGWRKAAGLGLVGVLPLLPALPVVWSSVPPLVVHLPQVPPPQCSRSSFSAPADSGRRAPLPFTEKEFRKRSKGWKIHRSAWPRWRLVLTKSFALRSDAPLPELRRSGVMLEEFLLLLRRTLRGDPEGMQFSARIFREERAFRVYASYRKVPDAFSFYDPANREIVAFLPSEGAGERLLRALAHELTHLYLHRVFDRTGPLWLAEGVAEHFRSYVVNGGSLHLGGDPLGHRKRIRRAGGGIALRDLIKLPGSEFYGTKAELHYALSWSFARLLMLRQEAIAALLKGTRLEEIQPLAIWEKEWSEHSVRGEP